ncbi:hypothetical protein ABPG72_021585 [Tetrahymena utriculariae]
MNQLSGFATILNSQSQNMIKFVMNSFTQKNKHLISYKTKKLQNYTRNNIQNIYKLDRSQMNILIMTICAVDLVNKNQNNKQQLQINNNNINKQINQSINQQMKQSRNIQKILQQSCSYYFKNLQKFFCSTNCGNRQTLIGCDQEKTP